MTQNTLPKNVLQATDAVEVISGSRLAHLKVLAAESPLHRSRILLHRSHADVVQEMVICIHYDSYIRPHRHPTGKAESYHIIEGELQVNIYNDTGKDRTTFRLGGTSRNVMYRLAGGIYHQPLAVSEWAIYHEVYTGPFDKDADVEYAQWAMAEAA